jgi:hypothetical protein
MENKYSQAKFAKHSLKMAKRWKISIRKPNVRNIRLKLQTMENKYSQAIFAKHLLKWQIKENKYSGIKFAKHLLKMTK